jgi:hypothetical protein
VANVSYTEEQKAEAMIEKHVSKRTSTRGMINLKSKARASEIERKSNQDELRLNLGTPITFGQTIQLKHILSGFYVTLLPAAQATESGCFQVVLTSGTQNSAFEIIPRKTMLKQRGEGVSYKDGFMLLTYDSATNKRLFLHASDVESSVQTTEEKEVEQPIFPEIDTKKKRTPPPKSPEIPSIYEVNGSLDPSDWKANLYLQHDIDALGKKEGRVYTGMCIQFYNHDKSKYCAFYSDMPSHSEGFQHAVSILQSKL